MNAVSPSVSHPAPLAHRADKIAYAMALNGLDTNYRQLDQGPIPINKVDQNPGSGTSTLTTDPCVMIFHARRTRAEPSKDQFYSRSAPIPNR